MQIRPQAIERYWTSTAKAIEALGGEVEELRMDSPASPDAVEAVERRLGVALPVAFKDVLIGFSKHARFCWRLPEDFPLPDEFREIFCGDINWTLARLVDVEESRRSWVRECFPDPDDPYDRHWHNKLAFYEVPNGDHLAIDLSNEHLGAIVYLSHDDGEGHGLKMANSFESLILNWSMIGGVGGEDWQWLPFYNHQASEISPNGKAAHRFRDLIGFGIPENW